MSLRICHFLAWCPASSFRLRSPEGAISLRQHSLRAGIESRIPPRSPLSPRSEHGGCHRTGSTDPYQHVGVPPIVALLAQHPLVSPNSPRPRPVLPLAPQRVPQLHPYGWASLRVPDHRKPVHCPDQCLRPGQLLLPGYQPHGLLHQERLQQVCSAQPGC